MSNTKSSSKNSNGLMVVACMSLFALMGTAQGSAAQNASVVDTAFDDPNGFVPWDGGFAAIQKQFAADVVSDGARNTPAAKPPPAAATTAATLAGIAGSQVINWSFNLDNMLRRMGEVRLENLAVNNGGDLHYNGNLWARAYGDRVNANSDITGAAFHEYTYGASVGADKAFIQSHNATALIGLMGDVSKTDRTFNEGGDGSTRNAGIGVYVTLLAADGWFADLAGRFDVLKTKFATGAPAGAISGNYNTNMETLSLEAGRVLKRADGWWVEPSLQAAIAWADGGGCDTTPDSQKFRVKLDSGRDLQYRAMVRFGRQIGGSRWYPYGKFAAAKVDTTGGTIHVDNALAVTPDYDGIRAEFGFGTIYRIDEFNQLYFDYNYAKALNYNSPWSANLGYRLLW